MELEKSFHVFLPFPIIFFFIEFSFSFNIFAPIFFFFY